MARLPWEITDEMFLSLAEIDRLLDLVRRRAREASGRQAISAKLDQVVIEGLLFSGLRNSEFCRLLVRDTPVATSRSIFVVAGSPGDARTVHIASGLCDLVVEYARDTRPLLLPDGLNPQDTNQPLLFNERHRPYERTGLYRRVTRILTEAGLGDRASVQLLRHTYGYLAYRATGGNLLFVQHQMGHAHPMITSVYARLVRESYETMGEQVFFPSLSCPAWVADTPLSVI